MASLSSKIVILGLKLAGIKQVFSKDPIDYKKLRKSDVKDPPKKFVTKFDVSTLSVLKTTITQINPKEKKTPKKMVIFIHGGAFVSGPAKHHWDSLFSILKQTSIHCWMVDYPKAPEVDIVEIAKNIDAVYQKALENYAADNIFLMGDSVGANLCISLTQRLIKKQKPQQLILITPVFDASMSNPEIDALDKKDPMLSKNGVLASKKLCANGLDLKNELISPLYGSFDNFPKTTLFVGGRDIMYIDSEIAIEKMRLANINLEIIKNTEMPHIWPLLPIMKESRNALSKIIKTIGLLLVTVFLCINCQSTQEKTNSNSKNNTIKRKWMLVKLGTISKEVLVKHKINIDLTNGGNAYGGCNMINFNYKTNKPSNIKFSDFVMTKMFCEDTNNIESLLLKSLSETNFYRIEGHLLTLTTISNDTIKCIAEDWD